MKHFYHFHPSLILRTPIHAFSTDVDATTIPAALDDMRFMEALYLASPNLYEECCKWKTGALHDPKKIAKLQQTLTRYYMRMRSRCTPFGLFAGCSVISWGEPSCIQLAPSRHVRHTRLDMHYLCAVAQHLAQKDAIQPLLRYWPQTSLYQLGTELRYVEYYYAGDQRIHQISSVEASMPLLRVLAAARQGLTRQELMTVLVAEEAVEVEEAALFVQRLIDAQLIVSELEPTVTGPEFLTHLRAVITRMHATAPSTALGSAQDLFSAVARQLTTLDQQATNSGDEYLAIETALCALGVPIDSSKLFQTDLICGTEAGPTLDAGLQNMLLEAVEALTHLSRPTPNQRLAHFKQRFQQRYDEQEVPLLEALDTESGLAYSDYGKHSYAPLVQDLHLPETSSAIPSPPPPSEAQQFLARKLREATPHQYCIELLPQEVRALPPVAAPLPPSLSIVFRVIGAQQLLLDSAGGSSAVNLLGRFTHASPALETIVRDITAQEQQQNPAVVFAEICHLPVSRVGNILRRPSFRDFEIPYLAQSILPAKHQVAVQDLLLSIRQGQLVLRSSQTNRQIVPRLSTAHNFSHQSLPVYEFLCDLQTQGLQAHLGVKWEDATPERQFYPRLTYQHVVLQAAVWHLAAADFQLLLSAPQAEQEERCQVFRKRWQLPRLFTLVDGDHELLVDADNPLLRQLWLDTIRHRPSIKLKEFLFEPAASPVRDEQHRPHTQQLLALLVREGPCYSPIRFVPAADDKGVPRDFELGSEWLYYKWYCGPQMANKVLQEVLRPLLQELQTRLLIDSWHFIRYADPDNHLRVRFHLPAVERLGEVILLVQQYLRPCLHTSCIWKSQTDTYRRELERYGPHTVVASERLFQYQSAAILRDLEQFTDANDTAYWQWGLRAVDELLEAFALPLAQKLTLVQGLRKAFAQEFNEDQPLKSQLDAKYRLFRPQIVEALTVAAPSPALLRQLAATILHQLATAQETVTLTQLLSSYIHMLINRLIPTQARLHELVLYDFLSRYYQSDQARQLRQPTTA